MLARNDSYSDPGATDGWPSCPANRRRGVAGGWRLSTPPLSSRALLLVVATQAGPCRAADELFAEVGTEALPAVEVIGGSEALERLSGSGAIIDQEELYRSHVFTTNEALRKVPGVVVRDEEGFGLRPNIGIRGMNPTRSTKTLLLEDGLPLSYAPYGDNASYYHPPVDRFSSIEVLKGASQILFGPQTISGTINYITPSPPLSPSGFASITGGSRDYLNGHLNYGGWHGDGGGLFDYIHKQGDGARDNTDHTVDDVNIKGIYEISDAAAVIARFNFYREDSLVGYSGITDAEQQNFGLRYNPFDNDEFEVDRYGTSVTHEWNVNDSLTATTSVYWTNFDRRWWRQSSRTTDTQCGNAFRLDRLNGVKVEPDACNSAQGRLRNYYTYGIEPRLAVSHQLLGLDGEFRIGLRAHREEQYREQINATTAAGRTGAKVEDNERQASAHSIFMQERISIGRLSVVPAVRFEQVTFDRRNNLTSAAGKERVEELIPALSASYQAMENLTVFAGVHEGFAPPRVEDLITNAGGSVDVDAEHSINLEAGLRSTPMPALKLDATYFRNDFSNQVAVGSIAGGDQPLAQGETLYEGLELFGRLDSRPLVGSGDNFYAQAAWTYTWDATQQSAFRAVTNGALLQGDTAGNRLPYAPEHTLTAAIGYEHPAGLDLMLETVYTGSQYADFLNLEDGADHPDGPGSINALSGQFGEIDANVIVNLAATYSVKPYDFDLFFSIKNLLDNDYIVDRTRGILPGAPRLIQAGLKYHF